MMRIEVAVTSVDLYGFCGRDRHPSAADAGQRGVVLAMTVSEEADGDDLQVFLVRLETGRLVDLLGHEFELVSVEHDGLPAIARSEVRR